MRNVGKIKIGLIILGLIALVGLVVAGVVMANSQLKVGNSDNGKTEYVSDEIIIKFKKDTEPFRVIKVPEGRVREKVKEYLKRADVEYAEPNYIAYALMVPNDPYYKYQWHLDNPVYGGIQTEEAWDISAGLGITVAVVDTGIRKGTDLANTCFVPGYDFVNKDTDPTDDNGHGTHVAGTVAQSTNNTLGVAGVAFKSCLMPVKVLGATGAGTYANVASGIIYAADNGAKVINLSLGGSADSTTLKDAIIYAHGKGVTLIAAAGNENSTSILYPAAYDDYVIAVGATQYDETKAPYSNYGPSLDLVAPGGNTSVDQNKDGYADGVLQQTFKIIGVRITWGYYFFQGTSMAAPHVSGVAALLLAKGNATAPDEIRTALQNTAECLPPNGTCPNNTYGYGLVDAYKALGWTAVSACTTDAECDDALYCNGAETCQAGVCQAGTPPCNDNIDCTIDTCDEANQNCAYTPNNTFCDDGLYCNGIETCDATLGCQAGTPVICDDDNECTSDTCDETSKSCQYTNIADNTPCTDGVCCSGVCQVGIAECLVTEVLCWSGTNNQYLYRNNGQAAKFCKCASDIYGFSSYTSKILRTTVYQYVDTGDNENWDVTSRSSNLPVYQVKCLDGLNYLTNQDYYYLMKNFAF